MSNFNIKKQDFNYHFSQDGDKFDVTEDEFNEFCEGNDEILLEVLSEHDVAGKEGGGDLNPALLHPSLQSAIRYENTYRTEPTTKFYPDKVSQVIRTRLEQSLGEVTYDQQVGGYWVLLCYILCKY